MTEAYSRAGVNREAANKAVSLIAEHAKTTYNPKVLSGVGFFGGLYHFQGYRDPVLVSSTDSVGTKVKIAAILNRYNTIGIDLVNQSVNDIITCGADPLFFLDYYASPRTVPARVAEIVKGIAEACKDVGCALIGGETAEMPGVYSDSDFDLVGFVVGAVEKDNLLDGSTIREGDVILGLPSSGLHTNGYSLVRQIFGVGIGEDLTLERERLSSYYPQLGCTLGDELLKPHRGFYNQLKPVFTKIKGLAHITGGGIIENVPRVLPNGLAARLVKGTWEILPIFALIQEMGKIEEDDMYRTFNMGIGMVLICAPERADEVIKALPEAKVVGETIKQVGQQRVILDKAL